MDYRGKLHVTVLQKFNRLKINKCKYESAVLFARIKGILHRIACETHTTKLPGRGSSVRPERITSNQKPGVTVSQ